MNTSRLWSTLFGHRPGAAGRTPRVVLHPLGLEPAQVRTLRPLAQRVGEALELSLEVDSQHGDIVVSDPMFTQGKTPQLLHALCEERPLVTCDLSDSAADADLSALAVFERRQGELLRQLRDLPIVRRASRHFGVSGWDPETLDASETQSGESSFGPPGLEAPGLDPGRQAVITWILRGLLDPTMPAVVVGYGPQAAMRLDFAQAFVQIDPLALQHLRVRHDIPRLAANVVPGPDAIVRDLDETVWDLGIACGGHMLLNQPDDWWHTPLATCQDPSVQRYTRLPRHMDLAAVLFAGTITPDELQRQSGRMVSDLRPFLQACLFLGLAWWAPAE